MRTIIISDIHSCAIELKELLAKTEYKKGEDFLLFIGDMIGKGPLPLETYLIYKSSGAVCIMGNAELAFLKNHKNPEYFKEYIEPTKKAMGKYYQYFLQDAIFFPHFYETKDYLAVHAGLSPNKKAEEMDLEKITKIRMASNLDGSGKRKPWFEYYQGKKLLVFGHWAALHGIYRENVIGIDTGAVYGKKLTALILPSRELVSVHAKKVYEEIKYSSGKFT